MHRNITHRIAQLAIGPIALLLLTLPGCKSEDSLKLFGPGNGQEQAQQPKVTFDLPAGWNWTDETREIAIKGEAPPFATEGPFATLKFIGMMAGTEEEAKAKAQAHFEQVKGQCGYEDGWCTLPAEYQELTVAGELLYISKNTNNTFAAPGDFYWVSNIYLAQDGKIIIFQILEDADLLQDELGYIINSLKY